MIHGFSPPLNCILPMISLEIHPRSATEGGGSAQVRVELASDSTGGSGAHRTGKSTEIEATAQP